MTKKILSFSLTVLFAGTLFFSGADVSFAQNPPQNSVMVEFKNPLKYDTVEAVVGSFLTALQGIIVTLAIVFIVIGGILYITSAGNEKQMELGKKALLASMIGLAIGIAAPSFLLEIYTILGGNPSSVPAPEGQRLSTIVLNVLNFLLSVVGTLALIMLVVGGIMYIMASGNEDTADKAKNTIKYAIIGIAVALAALVIVRQIAAFF
ncbi:MAG TPA: pilin [Patescibacteria group bacterium]|nr:pilin [Patescibacteria group bacterium]